jgi:hypothetical protein
MRSSLVGLMLLLAGCSQASWHPLPSQPRALVALPVVHPLCVFWCHVTVTLSDAEGADVEGSGNSVTEGAVTQTIQQTESVSAGVNRGIGTGAAAKAGAVVQ